MLVAKPLLGRITPNHTWDTRSLYSFISDGKLSGFARCAQVNPRECVCASVFLEAHVHFTRRSAYRGFYVYAYESYVFGSFAIV